MNIGITTITQNLGLSFENILLIIALLGCLVFFAKDFKLGLLMVFIFSGGLFMWFYAAGWEYSIALTVMFLSLIALSLSIYAVSRTAESGGVI